MKLTKMKTAAICGLLTLYACDKSTLNKTYDEFIGDSITIPYKSLDKRICSMYANTTRTNRDYKLVSYIKMEGCGACKIGALYAMDNMSSEKDDTYPLEPIYIIDISSKDVDYTYEELCKSRIKSPVYLDTCGIFRHANPRLPDNPLFHTFILDKTNAVVLIGNPYKNEKMTELLDKVMKRNR